MPAADAPVLDDVLLYRAVHSERLVWDDERQCRRISSAAFMNTSGTSDMSVVLGDQLHEDRRAPGSILASFTPDHGLVSLTAGIVRSLEQAVVRSPNNAEPAHGDVVGKKNGRRRRELAAVARWVCPPLSEQRPLCPPTRPDRWRGADHAESATPPG